MLCIYNKLILILILILIFNYLFKLKYKYDNTIDYKYTKIINNMKNNKCSEIYYNKDYMYL